VRHPSSRARRDDYNDGFVLPMAIERETVCGARHAPSGRVEVVSAATGAAAFAVRGLRSGEPAWTNYLRGVVAGLEGRGIAFAGLELAIDSSVPLGGGLSSSASLEVAAAAALEALAGVTLPPAETIDLCRKAEHEFAGVPCGVMDQSTVVRAIPGHALLLDCRSGTVTHVPMADPDLAVLIVNTNVRHDLASGEYARRRAECAEAARRLGVPALRDATPAMVEAANLTPMLARRARHVVSENERTLAAVDALRGGDWRRMGQLMHESHASLRDDFDVSCDELDAVVDIARGLGEGGGVFGSRMTGGGFGGCVVCLVHASRLDAIAAAIGSAYQTRTGRAATLFATRPAGGAGVLEIAEAPAAESEWT
jgi:galactokinase